MDELSNLSLVFLAVFPIVFFGAVLLIAFYAARHTPRIKKVRLEERLESLEEGGVEEPHPLRDLTPKEKEILDKRYKAALSWRNKIWLLVPLFFTVDVLFYKLSSFIIENAPASFPFSPSITLLIIIFSQSILVLYGLSNWPYYLDSRSPVFRVQGKALKHLVEGSHSNLHYITIRDITFYPIDYPNFVDFFNSINDIDEVVVEYSPRTKQVWKMYKTEDLK